MPVISIKTLPLDNSLNPTEILKKLCNDFAVQNGYKPEHVWAYWEFIKPEHYSVGSSVSSVQKENTHSPIVRILAFEGNQIEKIKRMLETIADVLSKEMKIDIGNIFIEYAEAHSGMVFDGGNVVYSK
jgi:phenylpyruvate tautomerase PptA (4-oxalocrotonate tautomerase family)